MLTSEVVTSARTASDVLRWLSWLVLLIGGIAGAAVLWAGFDAVEPWSLNGYIVDEEWMSIGLGFLGAALIAVYTGVVWGLIQAVRAVIWYVTRKFPPVVVD